MEIMLNTRYLGFQTQVWDDKLDTGISRVYFAFHLRVAGRRLNVEFYRTETDRPLYFHIKLPFFAINNDVRQEVMSSGIGTKQIVVAVVTGKIFWKAIYRIQIPKRKNN